TNVDCYQRAEGRYRLMRDILAALRDFANPFSILTKGTLILRDLDLLRQAAEVTRVSLSMSIGFVDEALWRAVEPGTPAPRRRLVLAEGLPAGRVRPGTGGGAPVRHRGQRTRRGPGGGAAATAGEAAAGERATHPAVGTVER